MSISSNTSTLSVSINGAEVDFDDACDQIFVDLQTRLNECQCALRVMAGVIEQDNDLDESCKIGNEILHNTYGMTLLFKDLGSIVKQIVVKPSGDEEKKIVKDYSEKLKVRNAELKKIMSEKIED